MVLLSWTDQLRSPQSEARNVTKGEKTSANRQETCRTQTRTPHKPTLSVRTVCLHTVGGALMFQRCRSQSDAAIHIRTHKRRGQCFSARGRWTAADTRTRLGFKPGLSVGIMASAASQSSRQQVNREIHRLSREQPPPRPTVWPSQVITAATCVRWSTAAGAGGGVAVSARRGGLRNKREAGQRTSHTHMLTHSDTFTHTRSHTHSGPMGCLEAAQCVHTGQDFTWGMGKTERETRSSSGSGCSF